MARKKPSLRDSIADHVNARDVMAFIALLTVIGILPVLIIGFAGIAVSSFALACIYLLGRKYEVWSR